MLSSSVEMILLVALFLISVAFLTLLERKILGLVGLRLGPNKVSFFGILQALMDAVKLMNKQVNSLSNFTFTFYYLSSTFMLTSALFLWTIFLVEPSSLEIKVSILFLMIILSFNSLNSILAGWSTFSKYSLIGSIRTVCQLISYESVLYLCMMIICYLCSTFVFSEFFFNYPQSVAFFMPIIFFIWMPSVFAELNRTPFDFSEGESELVSGFNTEFGSSSFTFLFLAEYSNILFMSFLSGMSFFFEFRMMSSLTFLMLIIWIRSVCPRYRFDKLLNLAWKFLLPFLTGIFLIFSFSIF